MEIKNLIDSPIDFNTLRTATSFQEWINEDISRAFYLGLMRKELSKCIEDVKDRGEEGVKLLKSIDEASVKTKPYLKEIAILIEPYLRDAEGFIVLDMVNDVLNHIEPSNEGDIFNIAYTLGIYVDYLFGCKAEA